MFTLCQPTRANPRARLRKAVSRAPRILLPLLAVVSLALLASGCGGGGGTSINADGSSTVGPFVTRGAEDFGKESDAQITVGISGTGGGFDRFCRGETDLSNASRPIHDDEAALCAENDVEYVELQVAIDALTNVVNTDNDWATCLTVDELAAIWAPGSKVKNWSQVRDGFPDVPLKLFGAGTDSGTFDYFTGAINGEEGASRTDYSASEDDNVTVQGVGGNEGGLGYFGFSYFEENQQTLKAVAVDAGDGCVAPSAASAQDGTYTPLARPLFVYAKTSSLANADVEAFVRYMLENQATIAEESDFIAMNASDIAAQTAKLDAAVPNG
jgi:phosphate transport system substrate-binding protein